MSVEPEHPSHIDTANGADKPAWPTDALHAQKMEAVGQLAGGIAHDMSNLMTAMFGWLEIASAQLPSDHAARDALRMVDRAARQAVGLTRSLITFSHRTPTEKHPMQLNDVVRDAMRLLGRLLPASIEQDSAIPEESIWIEGDATQIQQVVMNLALNARDAMPEDGRITIALEVVSESDVPAKHRSDTVGAGAAVLAIGDTGGGIPGRIRSRIFEPFFTTKERDRGTGLGLAIVDAIVSEHAGWIEVDSVVGQGSTFRVYFPRMVAPSPPQDDGHQMGRDATSDAVLLVVEDNPLVRAMLTTVLVDAGYKVLEAADGEEGRAVFAQDADTIDVAIVDVDLPKVNGVDVLQSFIEARPGVRGIAITGYPLPEETTERLRRLGFSCLKKPFHVPDLKRLIAKCLTDATR